MGGRSGEDPAAMIRRKIPLPTGGNVTALHDQILFVLERRSDDLAHDRPDNRRQRFVGICGARIDQPRADQPHFDVIHRERRNAILFQQFLGAKRFARVRRAGNEKDHCFFTLFVIIMV